MLWSKLQGLWLFLAWLLKKHFKQTEVTRASCSLASSRVAMKQLMQGQNVKMIRLLILIEPPDTWKRWLNFTQQMCEFRRLGKRSGAWESSKCSSESGVVCRWMDPRERPDEHLDQAKSRPRHLSRRIFDARCSTALKVWSPERFFCTSSGPPSHATRNLSRNSSVPSRKAKALVCKLRPGLRRSETPSWVLGRTPYEITIVDHDTICSYEITANVIWRRPIRRYVEGVLTRVTNLWSLGFA